MQYNAMLPLRIIHHQRHLNNIIDYWIIKLYNFLIGMCYDFDYLTRPTNFEERTLNKKNKFILVMKS